MIKTIKIFPNHNFESKKVEIELQKKLLKEGFQLTKQNYDLAIAIGGDGSFLRMLKNSTFRSNCYYIGINTGTLGFMQEIRPNEIQNFVQKLKNNQFKVDEIGIAEIKVETKKGNFKYFAFNDLVVRDQDLNTTHLEIKIEDTILEHFSGDGILIATSAGSTAYNLSFGGSIVYHTFHTLQITPIAPLNSKVYRNLRNSIIIPEHKTITLLPKQNPDLLLTIDGDNYKIKNIEKITITVRDKYISILRLEDYEFTEIVREKLIN